MSTIAARSVVSRRDPMGPKASVSPKVIAGSRRKPLAGRTLMYVAVALALVCVFVHVSLYAIVTAISFDHDKMANQFRLEKIENERLRIEFARRTSPAYAIAWAQAAGMVYSKDFEYLERSSTVASASDNR